MGFAKNLKNFREKKGLTQDALAELLFISRQSISKWENGTSEPNIEMLINLSEIFGVSVDELICEKVAQKISDKNKKAFNILFAVNAGIAIFTFLMAFVVVQMLPEILPMQYNFAGEVSRYGSRWEILILGFLPVILLGIQFVFLKIYNKNLKIVKTGFLASFIILMATALLFTGLMFWFAFKYGKNLPEDIVIFFTAAFSVLMIVISIFSHPKFNKQNAVFGFRTIFTLTDKDAWIKINSLQSIIGLAASIAAYLITVIVFKNWTVYLMGLIALSIVPTLIYHEILRNKIKRNNSNKSLTKKH